MSTHSISYPSHKFILIYYASFLYRHNCDRQDDSHTGNIHFFGPTVSLLKSRVITSNGDTSDMQEKPSCSLTTHAVILSFTNCRALHCISSLAYQILLLRVSVFIKTIVWSFNPIAVTSQYTKFLSVLTSSLIKSAVLSQIYHFLHQLFFR
jgi:hypothetical protein